MARFLVLGAGVMGTAFSYVPADAGSRVDLVGTHLDGDEIEGLQSTGRHPRLPTAVPPGIRAHHLDAFADLLAEGPDVLVLGVSSPGVEWAIERIVEAAGGGHGTSDGVPGAEPMPTPAPQGLPPIVMLTKGLDVSTGAPRIFPHRVVEALQDAGLASAGVGAIGGPCIAGELARRVHSNVVLGGPKNGAISGLRNRLRSDYYHIQSTTDLIGLEVSAALKNFYTIGIAAGGSEDGSVHNPSAALFAQAGREMARVAEQLGGDPATAFGLAGVGDLYVTCRAGRNSRLGAHLAGGLTYSEIRTEKMPWDTIEGADLALALDSVDFFKGLEDEFPLATAILASVCEDRPFQGPWEALTS